MSQTSGQSEPYDEWILVDNEPERATRTQYCEWRKAFPGARRVAESFVECPIGHLRISTVFLPLDYGNGYGSISTFFETLVFNGRRVIDGYRYGYYDAAYNGHQSMLDKYSSENPQGTTYDQ
jgi:hypothetical protein